MLFFQEAESTTSLARTKAAPVPEGIEQTHDRQLDRHPAPHRAGRQARWPMTQRAAGRPMKACEQGKPKFREIEQHQAVRVVRTTAPHMLA
jgi:hypothetical protein